MKKAKMIISKDFVTGEVDKRLYGAFVEPIGNIVYGAIYDPEHPKADEDGFRKDVLELTKNLGVPIVRFPGGNYASAYDWKDSIGPKEERPVRLELAWQQIDPNTFGLNEFMKWSEKAGTEPMMTINLGTRGIQDARDMMEYCNFPEGTTWSNLRKAHGAEKPYGVKVWCLGNENDGFWQVGQAPPEQYGLLARESAKVMKLIDPDIELVAVGSSNMHKEWVDTYPDWDMRVLMQCYERVDYISLHHYIMGRVEGDSPEEFLAYTLEIEQNIKDIIAVCDYVKAKKGSKKQLNISLDEWSANSNVRKEGGNRLPKWSTGHQRLNYSTLEGALAVGAMLIAMLRHADRVKIGCMTMLIGGPILAENGGEAWENSRYYILKNGIDFGNGTVLNKVLNCPTYNTKVWSDVPVIDSVSVHDEAKGELTIFAVNRTREDVELETDIRDFSSLTLIEHLVMADNDINAVNSKDDKYRVMPRPVGKTALEGIRAQSSIPAYSWNVIRFKTK